MSALTNRRGRESTGRQEKPVAGYPPTKGEQPTNPTSKGGGREGEMNQSMPLKTQKIYDSDKRK